MLGRLLDGNDYIVKDLDGSLQIVVLRASALWPWPRKLLPRTRMQLQREPLPRGLRRPLQSLLQRLVVWLYRATRFRASPKVCEDAMTY